MISAAEKMIKSLLKHFDEVTINPERALHYPMLLDARIVIICYLQLDVPYSSPDDQNVVIRIQSFN